MPDAPPSPAEVARGEGWIARALDGVSAGEVPHQVLTRRDGRMVCLNVVAPRAGGQGWSRYSAAAARRADLSGDRLLPLAATGQSEGTFFVAYLIGDTIPLSAYRDAVELTTSQCLQLLWGIGRGLDEAAAAGFHPTEVSPESVFVDHARGAYLADLGVAREGVGNPPADRDVHAPWVAPEILAGGSAVERSGVYSFGALMYTMLTGAAPHRRSREEMAEPASLREVRPDLPEALELVVATAMSRDPNRRYRTASEARSLAHIVLQSELNPTVSAPPRQHRFRRGHPPTDREPEAAREQRERDRHAQRERAAERERNRFDKQQRRAGARAKRRAERERKRLANEERKRRLAKRRERQWAAEQEHQRKRAAQREEEERGRAAEREREASAQEQRKAAERERERVAAETRAKELAAQREHERAAKEEQESARAAERERERAAAEKRERELAAQRAGRERAAAEKRERELAARRKRGQAAAEKREKQVAAQRERERVAAEARDKQAAAERERERAAAEKRDKQVAAQRERERAAAEERDKQVAAQRERERAAAEKRDKQLAAQRERERAAKEEREVALAAQRAHERAVREAREGELVAQRERERAAQEKRDAEARVKRAANRRVERERKARLRTARLERGRERRDATVRALRERTEGLGAHVKRARVATRQRVEQAAQARTRRERRALPATGGRARPRPERRSSLSRSVPLALVCSAVALGALGGVLIGGPGDAKPPQPQRLSAAGVGLTLPVGWEGNASAGGAIEAHPADDPGSGLRLERVNAPVEREEQANPVRLGRLEAWREPRVDIPGARTAVRYVVPTAAGKLVATCRASARAAPGTLARCEGAASTLRLRSATGLPLAAVIEQQQRWQAEVSRLASERADARRKLAAASLPAGQRLAAEALARVHERAAVRFGALPGGEAVAGAARRTAAAYTALATSAGGDSSGHWNAARERLRRAETALSRALASA